MIELAGSPTTWGVDFADNPSNPAWADVLDGIAASGCTALELGPVGYLPEDATIVRQELAQRGLSCVGTFIFRPMSHQVDMSDLLSVAERTCRLVRDSGGSVLVLVDQPSQDRAATAGQSGRARRQDPRERAAFHATLTRLSELAATWQLRPVLHPHAGSNVEFEDEIQTVLAAVPDELMGLCLDTGHFAYAGMDPAGLARRYAHRLDHIHLKDVDEEQLAVSRATGRGFWESIDAGIFCPVGQGMVDFEDFMAALVAVGYGGPATIEQDRNPGATSDPVADLSTSVSRLRPLLPEQQ